MSLGRKWEDPAAAQNSNTTKFIKMAQGIAQPGLLLYQVFSMWSLCIPS